MIFRSPKHSTADRDTQQCEQPSSGSGLGSGTAVEVATQLSGLDRRFSDDITDWLMDARQCHGGMLICSGLSIICALTLQPVGLVAGAVFGGLALFCDRERRRAEREIVHQNEVNCMAIWNAADKIIHLDGRLSAMEVLQAGDVLRPEREEAGSRIPRDPASTFDDEPPTTAYIIFLQEFSKPIPEDGPAVNGQVVHFNGWRRR